MTAALSARPQLPLPPLSPSQREQIRRLPSTFAADHADRGSGFRLAAAPFCGHRHLTTPADAAWPEIRTLAENLTTGRSRDADIMMWSAATTLSARDVQIFVAQCRAVGLAEAADQVITNAARRDAQAVLNIASALHKSEQYADAGLLLAAAAHEERA